MISKQAVDEQLKRIGFNFRFWGRSEVNELGRILMEDEIIAECVNGEYANGFAMLVTTNHRLLLVDKKPFLYLTVEDVRYEMITEFNFNHRILNATINVYTANKTLTFTSWNQHRLRKLLEYIQAHVLEMRQQQHMAQQFTAAAAAQFAQLNAVQSQMPYVAAQQQPTAITDPNQAVPQLPPHTQAHNAEPQQTAPQAPTSPAKLASRFASGRAALGTYTRSKLPSLRRHGLSPDHHQRPGESGDVYPKGYHLPYEYES
jgi:hypothetical protein